MCKTDKFTALVGAVVLSSVTVAGCVAWAVFGGHTQASYTECGSARLTDAEKKETQGVWYSSGVGPADVSVWNNELVEYYIVKCERHTPLPVVTKR